VIVTTSSERDAKAVCGLLIYHGIYFSASSPTASIWDFTFEPSNPNGIKDQIASLPLDYEPVIVEE